MRMLAWILFAIPAFGATPTPADKVVTELQKSWDEVKTFKCRFKQEVFSKQLEGLPDVTEGSLLLSKPGKLRWESETESTTTILNEKELVIIRKSLRRKNNAVDIHKRDKKNDGLIPKSLSFLTGRGKFAKLYKYELIEDTAEIAKLKLTPKDRPEESYIAEIGKDGYVLRALTTETVDTRVVTSFVQIEKNPKLEPELFTYKAEPTDVVQKH